MHNLQRDKVSNKRLAMTLFFIYTLVFLLGTACFAKLLNFSIQKGQWLGKWTDILVRMDENGHSALAKPLGLCAMCFSHLLAFLSFGAYVLFIINYCHWPYGLFGSIVWYLFYVPVCTVLNLLIIRI